MYNIASTPKLLTHMRLFHIFVSKFSSFDFLQSKSENGSYFPDGAARKYSDEDDLDQCLYYLQTLSSILRWSSENMWAALAENTISTDTSHLSLYRISKFPKPLYFQISNKLSGKRWRNNPSRVFPACVFACNNGNL